VEQVIYDERGRPQVTTRTADVLGSMAPGEESLHLQQAPDS
jgi:hypothetical protein